MTQPTRKQKTAIRKRDAKKIKLTGVCSRCGATDQPTSRHHLWYDTERFNRAAVIEVCDDCDTKIHQRDHNDEWVRELKAVRTIELKRDPTNPSEYIVMVDDQQVGHTYKTVEGLKLTITD